MSYADEVFIRNCRDILENGVWDTDRTVRPHWEDDGAPAHTVKKFGIVNRYDLSKEFPLLTLRRTYWKTAVDELLWILERVDVCQDAAGGGVVLQVIEHAVHLVEFALGIFVLDAELIAVGLADRAGLVGPLIPDVAAQVVDVV